MAVDPESALRQREDVVPRREQSFGNYADRLSRIAFEVALALQ